MSEQLKGHGHVTPNADGFLARCGGPSICKVCKAELAALEDRSRVVTTDWLKRIHRDLDACQKLIWANLRGCDPSYYEDAQERLREIDAMLAAAPAAPAADAGLVEALELAANRLDRLALEQGEFWRGYATAWADEARTAHRAKGVV